VGPVESSPQLNKNEAMPMPAITKNIPEFILGFPAGVLIIFLLVIKLREIIKNFKQALDVFA
jgi:hypothetical protein